MPSLTRRTWIGQAAATLALMSSRVRAADSGFAIGLELFPIDRALRADLAGTLAQVRAIGFREVEMFNFYDRTPEQLRRALSAADLHCRSVVVRPQPLTPGDVLSLEADPQGVLSRARDLGLRYLVCPGPWLPPAIHSSLPAKRTPAVIAAAVERMTAADWLWTAGRVNELAAQAHGRGLQLLYHNGSFEFAPVAGSGGTGYDALLQALAPEVGLELDCGWVQAAGYDPIHYLQTQRGRVRLAHIKDMTATPPNHTMKINSIEAGRGVVDWPRLIRALREAQVEVGYLEQEGPFVRPPLDSARESRTYLERVLRQS